jgi:purine-nucleoside/S-methyl-5'-thioadenosine phosphorylase / adenosine deaminase
VTGTTTLPRVSAPFQWRMSGGLTWIQAAVGSAHAAFSTRIGGVSQGPFRSLNLGILTDDDPDRVRRNRAVLMQRLGRDPGSIAMGQQVHGADVQVQDRPRSSGQLARVDAQVTTSAGLTPLVLVADCVPLALSAPAAVGAVHCGWRGVAAGIVQRAVDEVTKLGGGPVSAAVGPGIGPCCYEVGAEVMERLAARGHQLQGPALDLPACVVAELQRAGVDDIGVAGICVSCNEDLFFSHRRDGGVTGRQAALVWLAS